jgi:hypothetical protein
MFHSTGVMNFIDFDFVARALQTDVAGVREVGAQFGREGLNEWAPLELNE